jgi:hypothetical protein
MGCGIPIMDFLWTGIQYLTKMKILLAIFSAHKYDYIDPQGLIKDWFTRPNVDRVSALWDTWLKDVTVDYKIFRGRRAGISPIDEVWLDAPDDYFHSSYKLKALAQYALDHGYDYVLKIDDDMWVYWDRLDLAPTDDYIGGGPSGFAAGCAYWMSERLMRLLVVSPCFRWQEDFWVGCVAENNRIPFIKDARYFIAPSTQQNQYISDEALSNSNQYLTIHSLSPEQMRRHYKEIYGKSSDSQ